MTDHPSRAVSRYDGPRSVDELERYAQTLAVNATPDGRSWRNEALPATFRGNPAAVAFAVEYAKALDVSPVTAIIGIHIVDGKPTASAGLISALVRRAGHKIRTWTEGTVEEGTAKGITTIVREDDPDFEYRSEWTLARAVRAGLCTMTQDPKSGVWSVTARGRSGKPGGWETYTENMLKARSITECSRDAAEDAILGVHYTPEELGVDVDETGEPVYTVTQVPPPASAPAPAPAPAAQETPAPAAASSHEVDLDEFREIVRVAILDARSGDDLIAVWNWRVPGSEKFVGDLAKTLVVGDENGEETTVFALFTRAGDAIKAGTHLTAGRDGDDGDDSGPADGSPDDDGNGPENGDSGSDPSGREVTLEEAIAKGDAFLDADGFGHLHPATVPCEDADCRSGAAVLEGVVVHEESDTPLRDQLDAVVNEIRKDETAFAALIAWCQDQRLAPNGGESACRQILEAIRSGVALPAAYPQGETPEELIGRVLGGTVLSSERTSGAEAHARELDERRRAAAEEDREEARRATAAGAGPKGSGRDAYSAARAGTSHK